MSTKILADDPGSTDKRRATTFGGGSSLDLDDRKKYPEQMKIISVIWSLLKVFVRHGNLEVWYHLTGSHARWDVPLDTRGVEVRHTMTGPKVTLW